MLPTLDNYEILLLILYTTFARNKTKSGEKIMEAKEAIELYNQKYSRGVLNALAPKVYMLRDTEEGSLVLTDQSRKIPSREEWELMKIIIDDFYGMANDQDIKNHNDEMVISPVTQSQPKEKKKHKYSKGFVYFIKADNGLIKIGKTKDLNKRLDHFTAKLPYRLDLIHSIKTDDTQELEEYFHNKFSKKRKRGEWFELDDKDIREVKNFG